MKDFVNIIHNIINKLLLSSDNYVLLDNNNTMNYYYNNNFYNISIIHNLCYINLLNLITELNNKKFKLCNNFYNYNKIILLYKDELSEQKICINRESIKYDINNYKNIYYDICNLDYVYNEHKFDMNNLSEKYYNFSLDNNIFNLIELIIFYLKNNVKLEYDLKDIIIKSINITISQVKNSMLKIIIKKNINENYNDNINKLIILIKELELSNNLSEFIKYDILNYILFDVKIVNTYDININTVEEYLLFILLEKYNIINKEVINDIENININEDINDDYDFLFINRDKLLELRKIKESFNILKNYNNFINKIELVNKVMIKDNINILSILFYREDFEYNIFSIKMAYIYKLYQNINIKKLNEIFSFYNKIINKLDINLNYKIEEDNYIYMMIENKILKEFENNKILKIPEICNKFNKNLDTITILDYQDAIIILYEYIYEKNDSEFNNKMNYLEELFDSIIFNIKTNKMIKINNYRKSKKSYNLILDYNDDNENNIIYSYNEYNNNNENNENNKDNNNDENNENDEINENNESDESDENIDDKNIKYKDKYEKIKIKFNILKIVKNILINENFDKSILTDYNEIDDNLIEKILKNYNENDII
jgi:hypothetical protein